MIVHPPVAHRALNQKNLSADLVVVGGGLAGTCAAITAARASTGKNQQLLREDVMRGARTAGTLRDKRG